MKAKLSCTCTLCLHVLILAILVNKVKLVHAKNISFIFIRHNIIDVAYCIMCLMNAKSDKGLNYL